MATKARKKSISKSQMLTPQYEEANDMSFVNPQKKTANSKFIKIGIGVVILAVILGLIAKRYKSAFLVASVNNSLILRSELNQRLTSRFGSQMLEALIGEQLIMQEAQKQNIAVADAEIQAKISEIEKTLSGGMTLDDSLKLQGMSKVEFERQVKIQLAIDKMFSKDATISTAEVDDFIKKNGVNLTASTEAEKRTQAEQELKNQKVSQAFIEWFNKVKEAAKVERYL